MVPTIIFVRRKAKFSGRRESVLSGFLIQGGESVGDELVLQNLASVQNQQFISICGLQLLEGFSKSIQYLISCVRQWGVQ